MSQIYFLKRNQKLVILVLVCVLVYLALNLHADKKSVSNIQSESPPTHLVIENVQNKFKKGKYLIIFLLTIIKF